MLRGRQQLLSQNPGYFRPSTPLDITTSIDSLAPDSTFLPVLLSADTGPWVTFHNIVGRASGDDLIGRVTRKFASEGDGVVSLQSARVNDAVSQVVVPADHVAIHRHPRSILEVRRILLKQLEELRSYPRLRPDAYYARAERLPPSQPASRLPASRPMSSDHIQAMAPSIRSHAVPVRAR